MKRSETGKKATEPRLETLRLADLIEHPDQATYFPLFDEHKFGEMVEASGPGGGNRDRPAAGNAAGLPGNTIIGGHTRAKAARRAGLTTIPARVRYDLIGLRGPRSTRSSCPTTRCGISSAGWASASAVGIYRPRQARAGRACGAVCSATRHAGRDRKDHRHVRPEPGAVFERAGVPARSADRFGSGEGDPGAGLPGRPAPEVRTRKLAAGPGTAGPKAVFAEFFPAKYGGHVKSADAVGAFAPRHGITDLADRVEQVEPGPVRTHEAASARARR